MIVYENDSFEDWFKAAFLARMICLGVFSACFTASLIILYKKRNKRLYVRNANSSASCNILELRLLDVAAVVLVEDLEDIFDLLGRLWGQATQLEKLLVAEWVWSWKHTHQHIIIHHKNKNKTLEGWKLMWRLKHDVAAVQVGAFPSLFYTSFKHSRHMPPLKQTRWLETFSNSEIINIQFKLDVTSVERLLYKNENNTASEKIMSLPVGFQTVTECNTDHEQFDLDQIRIIVHFIKITCEQTTEGSCVLHNLLNTRQSLKYW